MAGHVQAFNIILNIGELVSAEEGRITLSSECVTPPGSSEKCGWHAESSDRVGIGYE